MRSKIVFVVYFKEQTKKKVSVELTLEASDDDKRVEKTVNDFCNEQMIVESHKVSMMNLVYSFVDGELIGNKTKYFMAFIQLGMSTD